MCSSAGSRTGCGAGVHARTSLGCLALPPSHPCVLACLGVYAPLSAGLSKCSPLTQNGSTLPQQQQNPENWRWGRGQGIEKKNRDTFPLASPCVLRVLGRPSEINLGGLGVSNWGEGRPGCAGTSPRNPVSQQHEQTHFWFSFEPHGLSGPPPARIQ